MKTTNRHLCPVVRSMCTDGRTQRDVARLRVAFPNSFANAPENQAYLLTALGFCDVITRNISDKVDAS
jgi:hypothetical protein